MSFYQIYIKSSLHVALAVTSLSLITYLEFDRTASLPLLLFTFCGTVGSYNAIKFLPVYKKIRENNQRLYRIACSISLISLVFSIGALFYIDRELLPVLAIIGVITAAYAFPLNRRFKNLRNVYGFKIFIIGFVWASVTVLLPLMEANIGFPGNPEAIATFIQRLLFVIVLTIPFDIRDRTDDPDYLGTLPMILGTKKAVGLGLLLLAAVACIEIFFRSDLNTSLPVFFIVNLVTGLLLYRSMGRQSPWLAAFWIEGIPIFWAALYLVTRY